MKGATSTTLLPEKTTGSDRLGDAACRESLEKLSFHFDKGRENKICTFGHASTFNKDGGDGLSTAKCDLRSGLAEKINSNRGRGQRKGERGVATDTSDRTTNLELQDLGRGRGLKMTENKRAGRRSSCEGSCHGRKKTRRNNSADLSEKNVEHEDQM